MSGQPRRDPAADRPGKPVQERAAHQHAASRTAGARARGRSSRARTTGPTRSSPPGCKACAVPRRVRKRLVSRQGNPTATTASGSPPGEIESAGDNPGSRDVGACRTMAGTPAAGASVARHGFPSPGAIAPVRVARQRQRSRPGRSRRFPLAVRADRKDARAAEPRHRSGRRDRRETEPRPPRCGRPVARSAGPAGRPPRRATAKPGRRSGRPKKKAKPVTIDPRLLERALLNRNSPR